MADVKDCNSSLKKSFEEGYEIFMPENTITEYLI